MGLGFDFVFSADSTAEGGAVGGKPSVFLGEGERGVEKGCAAEVDVAAGGESGRRRRDVVEKDRVER